MKILPKCDSFFPTLYSEHWHDTKPVINITGVYTQLSNFIQIILWEEILDKDNYWLVLLKITFIFNKVKRLERGKGAEKGKICQSTKDHMEQT